MRSHSSSNQPRGFTFLELVASLALISLVMAFLLPNFLLARNAARRASCQSNLAQLGAALHLYSQDYDGRFPVTENDWTVATTVYTRNVSVLKCPDEPAPEREHFAPGTARKVDGRAMAFSSYAYRPGLSNDDPAEEPVGRDWGSWHEDGVNILYLGGNIRWKPAADAPQITSAPRPEPVGSAVPLSGTEDLGD